ncbi:DUF4292 domain-containing protein [Sediminitomix flava]|uniref:Uncharacterized protein DUF4292 n=1 Tax=Sediminitomix flava TaxID=379075 RepID=A0A315ZGJ1_SEDFL|nr:DUF4292 domain-containing protein [Sediminitomix flava]PWJ44240.1 uncharacterized protein DUF4292 [Sediminitomix flava]
MSVRNNILFLLSWILLLGFSSCREQKKVVTKTKAKEFTVEKLDFKYLSAKAKASYQANDQNTKVTADFRIHKDEAIWVSLRSTGIEGLRLYITPKRIKAINRLEKVYYDYNYSALKREFDLDLNFEIIQSILLGELPATLKVKNKAFIEDDNFVLRNNKGDYKIRAYVDRTILKLSKLFLESKGRKTNDLLVNFSEFKDVSDGEGQFLPHEVKITSGESEWEEMIFTNMLIELDFSKIHLSKSSIKMPFSIPSKYKKKKL